MLRLTFSSKLDWGFYMISIAKTASKKIGALIRFVKFLSPEVALYLLVLHLLLLLNPWLIVEMWPAYIFSIGITLVDVLQNWLNWFHFLFLEGGELVILIDCMIFLSPFLDVKGCLCQQFLSSHS